MSPRASQSPLAAHLQSIKPPWTALLILKADQRAELAFKIPDGFVRRVVRGRKCGSAQALFMELANALQFPEYFGHNWDALEECLADLEWLPAKGYVLLFTEAECILADDEDDFATLLEVLNDAGEAWASRQAGPEPHRAKPFHTLLTVSERNQSKRAHWGVPQVTGLTGRALHSKRTPPRST